MLKEFSSAELILNQLNKKKENFENVLHEFSEKGMKVYKSNGLSVEDFLYKKSGVGAVFEKISKTKKTYQLGTRVLEAHQNPEKWLPKGKKELLPLVESQLSPLLADIVTYLDNNISEYISINEILKNIYAFGITNFLEELKEEYIKENNLLLLSDSIQHISDLIKEQEDAPFLYDKNRNLL